MVCCYAVSPLLLATLVSRDFFVNAQVQLSQVNCPSARGPDYCRPKVFAPYHLGDLARQSSCITWRQPQMRVLLKSLYQSRLPNIRALGVLPERNLNVRATT